MADKKLFAAIATLVGTTIGAGFLGIPFVVRKSGFLVGLFWIVFLGLIMLYIKLCLGEVILRTKGRHQLAGYASIYLGKLGKALLFFAMFFGIYAALLAYLLGQGGSLSFLVFGNVNNLLWMGLAFFALMSLLTYQGFHALKKWEPVAMVVVLTTITLIFFYFSPQVKAENLAELNLGNFFIPFGVILFALLGTAAMPEVERMLFREESKLKKAIVIGSILPVIVYILFAFVVVGSFAEIPEVSTLALGRVFVLLGMLTMFTAYFALSIAIRDMYRYDFGMHRVKAWFLANFIPLALFVLVVKFNLASFTQILGVAGIVGGGLEAVTILFMHLKAKKYGNRNPEYKVGTSWLVILLLTILFLVGMIGLLV